MNLYIQEEPLNTNCIACGSNTKKCTNVKEVHNCDNNPLNKESKVISLQSKINQ